MGIPIGELQERVSSHDFAEYWAHFQLEPWGTEREDLRSGIVASTIANVNRDKKKRARPFLPSDFIPKVELERVTDDDEELDEEAALEAAARIDEVMEGIADGGPDSFKVRKTEP